MEVDGHLLGAVPSFQAIELSPVAPPGACVMGHASQNKMLSAARHGRKRMTVHGTRSDADFYRVVLALAVMVLGGAAVAAHVQEATAQPGTRVPLELALASSFVSFLSDPVGVTSESVREHSAALFYAVTAGLIGWWSVAPAASLLEARLDGAIHDTEIRLVAALTKRDIDVEHLDLTQVMYGLHWLPHHRPSPKQVTVAKGLLGPHYDAVASAFHHSQSDAHERRLGVALTRLAGILRGVGFGGPFFYLIFRAP
jgi:hypothetical protein